MSRTTKGESTDRAGMRQAIVYFAAILLLSILTSGRANAQSTTGPMNGATPSDQPSAASQTRSTAQVAGKPNLAGTWKLNVDQSDNPMQKMREAQQESGEQGGGGGNGGGGGFGGGGYGRRGGGGGGNGGGMGGGNQQGGRRGGGMQMGQLVIEQTPTSAKVSDSSGRVLALYQASPEQGSQSSAGNSANNGGNAPPVAQWQENKLVTTLQTRNGGTTTRTYEMSPDNKQLIVTTTIQNQRIKEPVTIKQVYDPMYASTGGE